MAHYGTLRDYRFDNDIEDIRGANLYGANDEKLGEIDDVIFDHSSGDIRYLVVDTGGWLTSNKFLIPADRISPYHKGENDFYASLDKERIKMFPEYDEKMLEDEKNWREYETRYERSFDESPVLHKEGSNRTITPEATEMPGTGAGSGAMLGGDRAPDYTGTPQFTRSEREGSTFSSGEPIVAPGGVRMGASSGQRHPGIGSESMATGEFTRGRRWQSFEQGLRRNRERIARDCRVCSSRRAA